jgi:hypothetical protein
MRQHHTKQVIWTKMLEIGLGQSYKPSITQVVKKSSSLCMGYWKCLFICEDQGEALHHCGCRVWYNIMWKEPNHK